MIIMQCCMKERQMLKKLFVKKFYDRKQSEYFKKVEEKYFNKIKKVIYVSDLDATKISKRA